MTLSLGVVATVYNEAAALPTWLSNVTQWADHCSIYHAGPGGAESDDGTIEILEQWHIPIHRGKIDDGFGICRTAAVRSSPCEWVMVLDIDELFHPVVPYLRCSGESTPRSERDEILAKYTGLGAWDCWEHVSRLGCNLHVRTGELYDQLAYLKSIIEAGGFDCITTVRRHWHDLTFNRPTQNWHIEPDYQSRIVRNTDRVHFSPNTKMHERLIGARSLYRANQTQGPFFEHAHIYWKQFAPKNRAYNVACYDALAFGTTMPTRQEFEKKYGLN